MHGRCNAAGRDDGGSSVWNYYFDPGEEIQTQSGIIIFIREKKFSSVWSYYFIQGEKIFCQFRIIVSPVRENIFMLAIATIYTSCEQAQVARLVVKLQPYLQLITLII